MALSDPALGELADRFGISTQFYDLSLIHI